MNNPSSFTTSDVICAIYDISFFLLLCVGLPFLVGWTVGYVLDWLFFRDARIAQEEARKANAVWDPPEAFQRRRGRRRR